MAVDLATLVSLDLEHRDSETMDAVFEVQIAGQKMTCTIAVPIARTASLEEIETAARAEMAGRLSGMAEQLAQKAAA